MTAAPVCDIFVYGTLCRGQCRQACWPCPPVSVEEAFVRGRLFDLGPYPALLEGDDVVRGQRWTLRPEDVDRTLQVLDEIEVYNQPGEEDLYIRRTVDLFRSPQPGAGPTTRGYAYFLVPDRLPEWARRIAPRSAAENSGAASYASWPDGDRTVAETSSLADPFDPTP